jgi:sodium/proline symporter
MVTLIFFLYLGLITFIGILFSKKIKSPLGFILGDRKLGPLVIAISACASDMSAWLLIGLPGQAYKLGLGMIWTAIGCIGGTLFNWIYIAPKLRTLSEKLNILTIPDLLNQRIKDEKGHIRVLCLTIVIFFFTIYVSAQFVGVGKVISSSLGWNYKEALLLGAGIIILYTSLGGFLAVCWTDFIQGILMIFALVITPLIAILKLGGIGAVINKLSVTSPKLLSFTGGLEGRALFLSLILGSLAIGLGYPGQPHILTRYMAINKKENIKLSMSFSFLWLVISLTGAIFLGTVGKIYFPNLGDPEKLTSTLAQTVLPTFLFGILISAIISAIMSTVDSQLLVITSSLIEDLWKKTFKRELKEGREVLLARGVTVGIGLTALLLALGKAKELVYWLVLYAWGGIAATIGPVLILSLLWKKVTKKAAIAGMVVGALTVIIWHSIDYLRNMVYELFPAFILSLVIIYLVSKYEKS